MISGRIKKISQLIPSFCHKIVDIGCDHCYLALAVRQRLINASIIASDIKTQPLKNCLKTCQKYNLQDVKTIVSDGLMQIEDDYDVLVIAGMGGKTIYHILNQSDHYFANKTLILQPNNGEDKIRQFVYEHKLTITQEIIFYEKDTYYYIVVIAPGGLKITTQEEIIIGLFDKLGVINQETKNYFKQKISYLEQLLVKIGQKDRAKSQKFKKEITLIKNLLQS